MDIIYNDAYQVWRPDLYDGIMQLAIEQKRAVTIQSHFPLDECNSADMTLTGRFFKTTGQKTQYIVDDIDLDAGNIFPMAPECEYSFAVRYSRNEPGRSMIEYAGRALILDQDLRKNNLPDSLLLRLAQPNRIRPLRLHKREKCPEHLFRMPGLMLIDQAPVNRRQLLNALSHYYQQKSRPKPRLVNISAGGVCLETTDPRCQRFMGAEECYLFFFFSGKEINQQFPCVFLGKKVGIFRSGTARHAGLRIRFMREMIWASPLEDLKWVDLENDGSRTIRQIIETDSRAKEEK